jgi:protein-tyrosine phosphatase
MEGSINFRDFGGYKTLDGRQVKWRQLFRSGSLSMLSSTGTDAFGALNISVICDLRRKDEASMGMTPPPEAAFDEIQSNHGSLDAYLEAIGINSTEKQILQSRLLYT